MTIRSIGNFIAETTQYEAQTVISVSLGTYAIRALTLFNVNPLAAAAGMAAYNYTSFSGHYLAAKSYPSAKDYQAAKYRIEMVMTIVNIFCTVLGAGVYYAVNTLTFEAALILNATIILISLASKAALYWQTKNSASAKRTH